ncbi:TatD family hydrolase [Planctomycetota bacterium]
MKWIDTHCHLTFEPLFENVDFVLRRSRDAGVNRWITVGTDVDHSCKAVAMARQHEGLYATVGQHPHDAKDLDGDGLSILKELTKKEKVVAVGETGLDFHYNMSPAAEQRQAFSLQLKLAADLGLPVVVHTREAFKDTMAVLDEIDSSLVGIVLHCFTGTADQAKEALERGYFLSFTGVVTFKSADVIREAAQLVPMDRLMLETDSPYMSPEPMRKNRPNEPALMIHTARYLAELKQIPIEQFCQQVNTTSRAFFRI